MEEDSAGLRRRNSIPSSVVIQTGDSKSLLRTSTNWVNGQHHVSPPSPSASSSPVSGVEFELISLKPPSYISLKDILPFSPSLLSPTANAVISTTTTTSASSTTSSLSSYEISIRNRLVKQAAWAYLQPMSFSPSASGRRFWRSGSSMA
ncbi:hypothetical protein Ancab_014227 [Ancistrocladus abbreviatus]